MPRYHFNILDGYSQDDADGTELPDIYTAQAEAVRFAGETLIEMGAKFWDGTKWMLEVTDENKKVLFVLHFSAKEAPLIDRETPVQS